MGKVLKADSSVADAYVEQDIGTSHADIWTTCRVFFNAAALALWIASGEYDFIHLYDNPRTTSLDGVYADTNWHSYSIVPAGTPTAESWHDVELHYKASATRADELYVDGILIGTALAAHSANARYVSFGQISIALADPAAVVYIDDVKIGTSRGASDLFSDDFESGDLSAWTTTSGDVSVVDDPTGFVGQRVGIAFDDGPHEPNPTWTFLDSDPSFPDQFVSGYDTSNGRQTLLAQTDTGTATVYINDHNLGLFDPRNVTSPYFDKLDGKQILLQLYDPVTAIWEPQFQGWIDFATYDIDESAVNADGDPINASIQLECIDVFDQLGGYRLTPGLDGVRPPSGMEDGVYYAETVGTVHDRIVEILADVGIDSTRYIVASGNVHVIAVKYDPDESALVALRDACDAELPFIANMYVNRHGQFVFRGRYSRFVPDIVAAEPGSEWDFQRWGVGDGKAVQADPTRAQMRILSYTRGRQDIINVAVCYPQGVAAARMPNQIFADTGSITEYGRHSAPPMSDLLTLSGSGTTSGWGANKLCFRYAKLLVRNKQGPHVAVSRLQVKTVHPDDPRAAATWAFLTRSDISHIVNVAVGYPGGTGLVGGSPEDDYYIEGRALKVRPLDPGFDYVELEAGVTPAAWSMDIHGVFPPFSGDTPIMAGFDYSYEGDPGTVTFTDTSTPGPSGPITAFAWDFGDGGTDTVENPVHVYAANGTYEVQLTVTGTGGDGSDAESRGVKVTDV